MISLPRLRATRATCACAASTAAGNRFATAVPDLSDQWQGPTKAAWAKWSNGENHGKIWENIGKIYENMGKKHENHRKIIDFLGQSQENMRTNMQNRCNWRCFVENHGTQWVTFQQAMVHRHVWFSTELIWRLAAGSYSNIPIIFGGMIRWPKKMILQDPLAHSFATVSDLYQPILPHYSCSVMNLWIMISLQFINGPINRSISAYYPNLSVQLQLRRRRRRIRCAAGKPNTGSQQSQDCSAALAEVYYFVFNCIPTWVWYPISPLVSLWNSCILDGFTSSILRQGTNKTVTSSFSG